MVIELRADHPLLPLRVVLDRNRGGSFLASLLVGTAMLGTFLSLTYYFQGTLHYSALKSGFAFVPFSLGIITGATVASRLLPRFGPRTVMTGGLVMAAAGLFLFTTLDVHSTYVSIVLPAEVIVSLGMGMSFVAMSSTALFGVNPEDAGVASALVNATQQTGGSMGAALINTIATTATASYLVAHGTSAAAVTAGSDPRLHDAPSPSAPSCWWPRPSRVHPDPAGPGRREPVGRWTASRCSWRRLAPGQGRLASVQRRCGSEWSQSASSVRSAVSRMQRLVEHGVVAGLGDLDHRGHPAQLLVHGGADVRGDQSVLRAQQRQPAVHLARDRARRWSACAGELLEDPPVELPLPAARRPA